MKKLITSAPVRFLVAGGLNTLLTYLLYLGLLQWVSYRISYAIAFVAGLLIAYFLNRVLVFKSHRGYQSVLLLPLVYACQYCLGVAIMHLWIELLGQSPLFGPLIVVITTIPVTYFLSKLIFQKKFARTL